MRTARVAALLALVARRWRRSRSRRDPARGEYLARAGDCVSCHTAPGGAPFAGGLRIDTPFGPMLSPNITPDPRHRHRPLVARRLPPRAAHRREQARPGHVSDDAVRLLHEGHARGRRRDLRLPAHGEAGPQRGRREPAPLSVQPALDDGRVARALLHAKARTGRTRRKARRGTAAATWSKGSATAATAIRRATSWAASRRARTSRARSSTAGSRSTSRPTSPPAWARGRSTRSPRT